MPLFPPLSPSSHPTSLPACLQYRSHPVQVWESLGVMVSHKRRAKAETGRKGDQKKKPVSKNGSYVAISARPRGSSRTGA
ncbi:hypothetical protein E2C01_052632 [Portunus trituberculatus]|uniref:Uncharacterized protein n=1 Tax=Portunus trituberculatus TaxID=210409 RepID=A0A5B7GME8_PORTR|nr:hypothetical protein [Portunus trituberculatus]